ncbi:MAG TPA: WecB/TagA/CpsF family glycosyltransferase [Methylomirabilota bacterium]|jgi:N-acetylglucosaminyldiphosphoundecaprenol N-acetyl-beta-D-mannosaminyltransferase|nr:WecB/TagA/CpsF family glycosyltransferase [Methylomirabilota bacterium]
MKVNVAGVEIDNISKAEAIAKIDEFVRSNHPHYVVTPYSELIVFALKDPKYQQVLNSADLALADGIGIIWAAKFLSLSKSIYNLFKTLLAVLFNPKFVHTIISERISGSKFIFDIIKLASEKKYSISLVGGLGNVAEQAAFKLKELYPDLDIRLALSGRPFNEQIMKEIAAANSDILLIAYSPPKQEFWIAQNYQKTGAKVTLGLGGTFDYIAGIAPVAPQFMHYMGLEWLWRLITQPGRWKRMWNAVPVFIWKVYQYASRN